VLRISVIFDPSVKDVSVVHSVGIVGVGNRVDISVDINSDVISTDFTVVVGVEFNSNRVLNTLISHTSSITSDVIGDRVNYKYKSISS